MTDVKDDLMNNAAAIAPQEAADPGSAIARAMEKALKQKIDAAGQPRVAVYTICKNEEQNVEDWYDSAGQADLIVVADTGSKDNTLKKFKKKGKLISLHQIAIDPWRFDDAHNAALALVPASYDICIPLHLDERLMPGWRDALEAHWVRGETTKCFYTYVFSHKPDGSPELSFLQNRIHTRKGYRWRYPDHEGVYPYGDTVERSVTIPELRIEQFQDRAKDRTHILKRLQMGLAENPGDSRMLFYLGREFWYYNMLQHAVALLEQYIVTAKPFPVERAEANRILADCWARLS